MPKKISKPYSQNKDYNCFGCSPHNPIGLNLNFVDDGEYIVCTWNPSRNYEGFFNIVHGGIQATLIDEIAAWCINVQEKTAGVTADLRVSYKKPVKVSHGAILLKAKKIRKEKNRVTIAVELFNGVGELCTEGEADYFTFPEAVAKRKFDYPGIEAFYQEEHD